MSSKVRRFPWNASKAQLLVSVAAAVLLSACSSGADRLTSTASGSDPVYTASVPQRVTAANVGVEDEVSTKPLSNAAGSVATAPPTYDYSKSYQPQQYRQPAVSAAPPVAAQPEATTAGAALPGSTVTVGPGMTLYSVARANNISVSQLAAANGIKPPYAVHTGQMLRIPSGAAATTASASGEAIPPDNSTFAEPESTPIAPPPGKPIKTAAPVSAQAGSGEVHVVTGGETLFSLGRKFGVSPFAIADANGLSHDAQLTAGQKLDIPGSGAGAAPVAAKAAAPKLETAEVSAPAAPKGETETVATAPQPAPEAEQAAAAGEAGAEAAVETAAKAEPKQITEQAPIDGLDGMRWPVRGKIISGFGPKANGLKNEGINIAVPEGTSIRAADGGVVAYAGNELKGYGNLILIRHENGYVTAYAHAKEIFVKRGDTVKRGDVIAKAGQTGSVSSPQLHFEVRKGATALDPMKFLPSATASN